MWQSSQNGNLNFRLFYLLGVFTTPSGAEDVDTETRILNDQLATFLKQKNAETLKGCVNLLLMYLLQKLKIEFILNKLTRLFYFLNLI